MSDGSVTIDTKLNTDGAKKGLGTLSSTLGKVGSGIGVAFKAGTVAVASTATALVGLGTASVSSYADLEQNLGGIETLFKGSADKVIKNAENAYKTAGMSANQYMETVTSFSASLLQSLGGDTEKAADTADMALTDMADNANKMGTSMELIQNAYQGFAKQNYTMLDNLKLGYGGTQQEMKRLLADAEKLTGVKYDINNLSDVYNAIHAIQENLGITGTTAKEASATISGSITSMKSAFDNFLNGSGTIEQVLETGITAIQNITTVAGEMLPKIAQSIANATPQLIEGINQIFPQILNLIIQNTPLILSSIGQILMALSTTLLNYLPQIITIAMQLIEAFANGLIAMLPQIIQMGMQLISQLIVGIAQMLPQLIPQALNCILTIVEGLISNIDLLINAGLQLIIGLAEGLINAIPVLVEKIPIIIQRLIEAIINNLPRIIEMGIRLLVELGAGLIAAIPQLIAMIPQIISSIINAFLSTDWGAIGRQLLQGLLQGFTNAGNIIWNAVKSVGNSIISGVKSFFGIHSPSKVFADLGKYLPQGFAVGIDKDSKNAVKSVEKMNKSILGGFNFDGIYSQMKQAVALQTGRISTSLSTTANVNRSITANITVDGGDIYMDTTKVGRKVMPVITKTLRGAGAY